MLRNTSTFPLQRDNNMFSDRNPMETACISELVILEQPAEMFRFRYKSEMHGTHGSLYGERSDKKNKTFPEVELKNCNFSAVISCSLYQANIDKPMLHSHQLIVRKDDKEVCDPHDVNVSPEKGYIARFENMGIIHIAKKDISKELLKKKIKNLKRKLQCTELSQIEEKDLRVEAEKEAKVMKLNQVRLCFEAYKIVNGQRIQICKPVFSRPINNRKSALTGELKICRLSMIAGSAAGGDDLILLVEKVIKNNIKVRFYELVNDEEVWEAFGSFTEADVHHQYAIVVRTPAYRDKDIDCHRNVFIELVRESDNERSLPVSFRYKPRDIILSRKRRRATDLESIPNECHSSFLEQVVSGDFEELKEKTCKPFLSGDELRMVGVQADGEASLHMSRKQNLLKRHGLNHYPIQLKKPQQYHSTMELLTSAFDNCSKLGLGEVMSQVVTIFEDYTAENEHGDTIVHDIVRQGSHSDAVTVLNLLLKLNLTNLLSKSNNRRQTPLHLACRSDNHILVRNLLKVKCNPNTQDSNGNTALHIAVSENLKQCTECFITHSELNVNLANDDGLIPLHLAIRRNNIDFVKLLLVKCDSSAKISSSCDGNNALHFAVQQSNPEIVKVILENSNVQVNAKNRSGHTAIDLAKTLEGDLRKEILDLLHAYLPSSADMLPPTIDSIKEEPQFDDSNSSDDDESFMSINNEIKEENDEINCLNIKQLLYDEKVYNRLGQRLNECNKWRKLGSQLKLDHLLFRWTNAEDMLKYVIQVNNINTLTLLNALETVDKEAANIVTALWKSSNYC